MLSMPQQEPEYVVTWDNTEVVLVAFGAPNALEIHTSVIPQPQAGQVRVRTLAASVQYTDVILRKGSYPDLKDRPPLTLGYDVVGEVDAVGPGVQRWAVGDRVADLTMTGSYAQYRLLDAERCVAVPANVDPAQAVTLVLSWMTAYQLLHRHARVQRKQRVLIHGAAGAVGQALVCLGALHDLEMYGTCRAEHADLVESLGATAIDYRNEDFTQVVDEGFDVVFDGIAQDGFRKSWSCVKRGGFLSAYGLSAAVNANLSKIRSAAWFLRPFVWNVLPNGKRSGFYSITAMRKKHPDWFREDLEALFELLRTGQIRPRVNERIGFNDVADAHRRLEKGGLQGKIVLIPNESEDLL